MDPTRNTTGFRPIPSPHSWIWGSTPTHLREQLVTFLCSGECHSSAEGQQKNTILRKSRSFGIRNSWPAIRCDIDCQAGASRALTTVAVTKRESSASALAQSLSLSQNVFYHIFLFIFFALPPPRWQPCLPFCHVSSTKPARLATPTSVLSLGRSTTPSLCHSKRGRGKHAQGGSARNRVRMRCASCGKPAAELLGGAGTQV